MIERGAQVDRRAAAVVVIDELPVADSGTGQPVGGAPFNGAVVDVESERFAMFEHG